MNPQIRILISIAFITSLACSAFAQDKLNFEYATPESSGFSAVKLDSLSKFLTSVGSSSLILLVDGKIIFEWGKTDYKHTIHSIRKPLINALYGIYVERGIIDTTATLQDLNIDDIVPSLSENEKSKKNVEEMLSFFTFFELENKLKSKIVLICFEIKKLLKDMIFEKSVK